MIATMPDRAFWTAAEVATELGMTIRGVQDRLERGLMKGERVHARLWLIPEAEVRRQIALGKLKRGPKPKQSDTH